MNCRVLANNGPQVSALELGCMGMSDSHDPIESIATIQAAICKESLLVLSIAQKAQHFDSDPSPEGTRPAG